MSTDINNMLRETTTLEALRATLNGKARISSWTLVDQTMINAFAQATGDFATIHTDPEQARHTRFKGTIAHGFLTLSLLPQMIESATPLVKGLELGVNYGFDRLRFVEPVPVNSRIRTHITLIDLPEVKPGFYHFVYDIMVEIEGLERPALVARWIVGRWIAD